jgi:hypothetical protein
MQNARFALCIMPVLGYAKRAFCICHIADSFLAYPR